MSRVLVLAVHPDDETLGCGGTLLRHKSEGDELHWLIGTAIREEDGFKRKKVIEREMEIKTVAKAYGFREVHRLDLPTTKLDSTPIGVLITKVSDVISRVKPDIIYLPFSGDVHSDHRVMFDAAFSCTKVFRYPFIRKIMMMEVLSETEFAHGMNGSAFSPNYFVDITGFLRKKMKVIKSYGGELAEHPFPRSIKGIEALAVLRGAQAGVEHAEAFMLIKEIV